MPPLDLLIRDAPQDELYAQRIEVALRPLVRGGKILIHSARTVGPGQHRADWLAAAVSRCQAALLVLSADYLAWDEEHATVVPSLLQRHQAGGCDVVGVLARPCGLAHSALGAVELVPATGEALSGLGAREEQALVDLTNLVARWSGAAPALKVSPPLTLGALAEESPEDIQARLNALLPSAGGQDTQALFGVGVCSLALRRFAQAIDAFKRYLAVNNYYPDAYFYYAIAQCRGRNPRRLSRTEVSEIEQALGHAMALDQAQAKYDILLARIRHDYFVRQHAPCPTPEPALLLARARHKVRDDKELGQVERLVPI